MKKYKILTIIIILISFLVIITFLPKSKNDIVEKVVSTNEFVLKSGVVVKIQDIETFDNYFSVKNKVLAKKLNLSENECFILGNLAKYWTRNLMAKRSVEIINNDLIYYKFSYKAKFKNTPFALKDSEPINNNIFNKLLVSIRNSDYKIYDIDNRTYYSIEDFKNINTKNYLLIRIGASKSTPQKELKIINNLKSVSFQDTNNIKLFISDSTTQLKPTRACSSEICKEILKNINEAKYSIDMAIYGYSTTTEIDKAIDDAIKRGVQIRLVYDTDINGNNIYPDTFEFIKNIKNKINDKNSPFTMHNKFYIFDNYRVITGSANLSHTDMSGFNSNSIVVIDSADLAKIYTQEFEQMYYGKFHQEKICHPDKKIQNIEVYFSPQDKTIKNGIIPKIKEAKTYIYIPTFVITKQDLVKELIQAKRRGVDVKIILDALSASNQHSKDKELRQAGIELKTENYAGKMHSKSIMIDDKYLIIGSMNFSNSGENKNDENCLIIHSEQLTKSYKNFFLYQWQKIPTKYLKISARAEAPESIGSCEDGLDNDYDGLTDKLDNACKDFKNK